MGNENHGDDVPCAFSGGGEETTDLLQLDGSTSARNDDGTEQFCPVCSRTLVTDNRGLNEHIDFCLSRGAIREARSLAGVR